MKVGITSTVPSEVLLASGHVIADLNNGFITSGTPPPEDLVADAERRGLSPNLCSWVKGLYAYALTGPVDTVVVASGGDCADMAALSDLWEEGGIDVMHFAFPPRRDRESMQLALMEFCDRLGTTLPESEAVREALLPVRRDLSRLDRLTWEWGAVSGEENHRWLVTSSDFEMNPELFHDRLGSFLDAAEKKRDMLAMKMDVMASAGGGKGTGGAGPSAVPQAPVGAAPAAVPTEPSEPSDLIKKKFSLGEFLTGGEEEEPEPPSHPEGQVRLGIVGVPPIMPDIHRVVGDYGGTVVYNESPFQFSMPYPVDDLADQYDRYTYPYGAKVRLVSAEEEVARRGIHGLILYQEAFCYKSIQNTYIRGHSPVPTLDVEASKVGPCDARTRLRLEAFVQMLRGRLRAGNLPAPPAEVAPPDLLHVPGPRRAKPVLEYRHPNEGGAGGDGGLWTAPGQDPGGEPR